MYVKKGNNGGARPGTGKPRGLKWPSTLRKEEAREKVRQFINEHLGEFLDAMADSVTGIRHLMMRDPKTGKFERITGSVEQIEEALKTIRPSGSIQKPPASKPLPTCRTVHSISLRNMLRYPALTEVRWRSDDSREMKR